MSSDRSHRGDYYPRPHQQQTPTQFPQRMFKFNYTVQLPGESERDWSLAQQNWNVYLQLALNGNEPVPEELRNTVGRVWMNSRHDGQLSFTILATESQAAEFERVWAQVPNAPVRR